jgi:hypothetical protein
MMASVLLLISSEELMVDVITVVAVYWRRKDYHELRSQRSGMGQPHPVFIDCIR